MLEELELSHKAERVLLDLSTATWQHEDTKYYDVITCHDVSDTNQVLYLTCYDDGGG